MLVLTQKEGVILQIRDDTFVHIKRVKGNSVRLAINAPREVAIQRIPFERTASPNRAAKSETTG